MEIILGESIGFLKKTFKRADVHKLLGKPDKKDSRPSQKSVEGYSEVGIYIHYDKKEDITLVELVHPAEPYIEDCPLIGTPGSLIFSRLKKVDSSLYFNKEMIISRYYGMSFFAPGLLQNVAAEVKGISIDFACFSGVDLYNNLTDFTIQISRPEIKVEKQHFRFLDDAFYEIFQKESESCFITWNNIPISISYRKDMSTIFHQIIPFLEDILNDFPKGFVRADFETNWLHVKLFCKQIDKAEYIEIRSDWDSLVINTTEEILNEKNIIIIKKYEFLAEWKKLFEQILNIISSNQILISEDEDSNLLQRLKKINQSIPNYGKLYNGIQN